MKRAFTSLLIMTAFLVGISAIAHSQATAIPVAKPPIGAVAVPGGNGGQPPGGGGGGANLPNNYQVQTSSPTQTNSAAIPKTKLNPQGAPDVQRGLNGSN
jgi:hypothetical protein